MKRQSGFSLIEIMIVVMIIGGIAVMALKGIGQRMAKIKIGKTQAILGQLKSGLFEYSEVIGHVPTMKEGGLKALVQKPSGDAGAKWKESILEGGELPQDAWGFDFEYNNPPKVLKKYRKYEIFSRGELQVDDAEVDPALSIGE